MVSDLGNIISDQLCPIVPSGFSGLGNLTAALQVKGGGANVLGGDLGNNATDSPPEIEYYVDDPLLLPIPSDGRGPTLVKYSLPSLSYRVAILPS